MLIHTARPHAPLPEFAVSGWERRTAHCGAADQIRDELTADEGVVFGYRSVGIDAHDLAEQIVLLLRDVAIGV